MLCMGLSKLLNHSFSEFIYLFEHFGRLTQFSKSCKSQAAWILMEIPISVEHNGLLECLQFCKLICVNRSQEIECGNSWEGVGSSSGEEQLRQWMGGGQGGWGIISPQHCEGTVQKNHCWEKRGGFRDNLQSRCANCGSSYVIIGYWDCCRIQGMLLRVAHQCSEGVEVCELCHSKGLQIPDVTHPLQRQSCTDPSIIPCLPGQAHTPEVAPEELELRDGFCPWHSILCPLTSTQPDRSLSGATSPGRGLEMVWRRSGEGQE